MPIKAGNEVIGGVGVSGAPGGDKDEVCANAGIAKVGDSLKWLSLRAAPDRRGSCLFFTCEFSNFLGDSNVCPLLAQSGHQRGDVECPLLKVKRTSDKRCEIERVALKKFALPSANRLACKYRGSFEFDEVFTL